MNFRKRRAREEPEINLIPFIDVLLVILIFLMVTTTYSKFTELQITLPTADATKAQDKPNEINVTVDAKGLYTINRNPVAAQDAAALAQQLQLVAKQTEGGPSPVVIINADQFAQHQMVINVLEAARLAGLEKITFAAQTSGGK
ncbi:MAG TPA: biopolymer transporter ExbD [Burkholderiaceae bacterium]